MSENPPDGGAIGVEDDPATSWRGVEGSKGTVAILARLVRFLEEDVDVDGVEVEDVEGARAFLLVCLDLDPPVDMVLLPLIVGEAVGVASDPEPEPMFIKEAGVTGAKVEDEVEGATGRGVKVGAMTMPPGELGAIAVILGARSGTEVDSPEGVTASHETLA